MGASSTRQGTKEEVFRSILVLTMDALPYRGGASLVDCYTKSLTRLAIEIGLPKTKLIHAEMLRETHAKLSRRTQQAVSRRQPPNSSWGSA
jgi:hypothetical protein